MKHREYKKRIEKCLKRCLVSFLIFSFALQPFSYAEEKLDKKPFLNRLFKKAEKKSVKQKKKMVQGIQREVVKIGTAEKKKLTLDECIDIAMRNHLPLKIAKKQLKLAEFRVMEAQRKLGPKLTGKIETTVGVVDEKSYEGQKFYGEIKQPIFYGGELVYAVKQAIVNADVVRIEYERINNEIVLQVKKAYYSLDKAKKALKVQHKLYGNAEKLYDIAKTGYDAGVVAQVEFLKVSSQYNQANFQLVSAEEDISVANLILQQAMNIDEEIDIEDVGEPNVINIDLENCFDLAYLNRAEIKLKQLSLDYFTYEKKIMQARANWPRVDFLGMYGNSVEDYKGETLYAMRHDSSFAGLEPRQLGPEYYFGTKITMPIWGSTLGYSYTQEQWQPIVRTIHETQSTTQVFSLDVLDKLEDMSGVREQEVERMRAQDEINKNLQEITLEVKETFFKYKKAALLMKVAKTKVMFQAKQVEVLEARQKLGEAQFSDVIEEMIKLAEEEFGYLQAIADYFISIATLNKAVGLDGYFES